MKSDHPVIAIIYWILRNTIGKIIRLCLIKSVTFEEPLLKNKSAILAFNHQSFFDFLCVAAVINRNIHFLAAEKFFENKWWRILMFLTGQIKVDRIKHEKFNLHASIDRHIQKGKLIGIFPEGTRSPYVDLMLKAYTGVAQISLKHAIPIIPVGIKGTFEIMSKHDRRPKLGKTVSIHFGKQIHFSRHHGLHDDKEICLQVTERIIKDIEELSGKKYPYYEHIK